MRYEVGDHLIIAIADENGKERNALVRFEGSKRNQMSGILADTPVDEAGIMSAVEFNETEVLANLGPTPYPGKVYKVSAEPWLRTVKHPKWGLIHFFVKSSKKIEPILLESLNKVYKECRKYNITHRLPLRIEVRNNEGKVQATYKTVFKLTDDNPCDVITFKPTTWDDPDNITYITFHEMGHPVWHTLFTPKDRRRWINLYHDSVKILDLSDKDLEQMRSDLCAKGRVSALNKALKAEEDFEGLEGVKAVMRWIKSVHRLRTKDIDYLLEAGDNLAKFWPNHNEFSMIETNITEYAGKEVDEFWCEAMAHFFTQKKMPKTIRKMVRRTLKGLPTS